MLKELDMAKQSTADIQWFIHDRFGLFIHWGIYALAARHEWVQHNERIPAKNYQPYFDHFHPDLYDPIAWTKLAKAAGMKYVVMTTKHHDGFCLWDSALTDYKAPNTPWGKDLLTPMVNAFRAEGLKIGFYHSLLDWHHPEFPLDLTHPMRDDAAFCEQAKNRNIKKYVEYLHGQTRELLTQFGKIDMMWFDYSYITHPVWGVDGRGKGKDDWQAEKLMSMVRELQPHIIVNDRLGLEGDVKTPEEYQPQSWLEVNGQRVVWEACQTLNHSWGYHRDQHEWKSVEMLVKMLIDSVSKGGNILLNVGPTGRGEFEPKAIERLNGIGDWMRRHSRSIYGCTAGNFTPPPDCRYTQNGNRLYLHLFSWPYRHVHLPGLAGKVAYAQLLNDASEIPTTIIDPAQEAQTIIMSGTPGALTLELPVQKPDVAVPVIELFLK